MVSGKVLRPLLPYFLALMALLAGSYSIFSFNSTSQKSTLTEPIATSSPESIVGQTFIVGIPSVTIDSETKDFLSEIKPGGIVLYKQNIDSTDQLAKLISDLQKIAVTTTGRKYLIMIDEEPGGASRLNLFQNVFATGEPDWFSIQHDIQTMRQIGINVDLAPVADFPFDRDSFISRRMPAHTVSDLVRFNKQFISLLQNNTVGATLKHFPGMGVFVTDPHAGIAYSQASTSVINQSIEIFKKGIDDGASFVMTNHGVYDQLDPNTPTTLSTKIVELLRKNLQFKGIIITDDLSDMPFIINKNISIPEATAEAVRAGHTMVLFSRNKQVTLDAFNYVTAQYRNNSDVRQMIDSNYKFVVGYKTQHSL